jgi:arginine repressor
VADEEIERALLAIHSRLGTVEGKVTLLARAQRDEIAKDLQDAITKKPLLGQIYLLLDGKRSQREIRTELARYNIDASEATVSRRMTALASEYGIADLVDAGSTKIYAKDREVESVLNLSRKVKTWLVAAGETVPETVRTRSRPSPSE